MSISTKNERSAQFVWEWSAALVCFIVAGMCGTYFRLSAAGFSPLGELPFEHLRNAHSHLMLFSWASPPLMILMTKRLKREGAKNFRERSLRRIIRANLLIGALSFGPFLVYGYKSAQLGSAKIPLTIILSTLGMFVWYAFAWVYWRARRGLEADLTWRLWDLAVFFLALCTLGAWARGVFMGMKLGSGTLNQASIQFFVITFSFGWLGLGVLGELFRRVDPAALARVKHRKLASWLLGVGTPLVFLNAPMGDIPQSLRLAGNLSSLMLGAGLCVLVIQLFKAASSRPPLPTRAMGLVGFIMVGTAIPFLMDLGNQLGLRVLFVHLLLLGVVTLSLLEARALELGEELGCAMPMGIAVLLVTMLPTTGLWPAALYRPWAYYLVAAGSSAPWLAASWLVIRRRILRTSLSAAPTASS